MKRKIIQIHANKCNGCGACVNACHEGAIQMVNGKARLISDKYCDGLGDCLPACPADAIEITEREAEPYDDAAVQELKKQKTTTAYQASLPCGCPNNMSRSIERQEVQNPEQKKNPLEQGESRPSQLRQWPVQLSLVNPQADYLEGANLLIAADCSAFAYGDFHRDFIKDHVTVIGCPKLDDIEAYCVKLTEILDKNEVKSITVVRMEVPCCGGIVRAVKEAMLKSETIVPYKEIVIGIDGLIKK